MEARQDSALMRRKRMDEVEIRHVSDMTYHNSGGIIAHNNGQLYGDKCRHNG